MYNGQSKGKILESDPPCAAAAAAGLPGATRRTKRGERARARSGERARAHEGEECTRASRRLVCEGRERERERER